MDKQRKSTLQSVSRSLADIVGEDYINAVCRSRAFLEGCPAEPLLAEAHEKVDFYPDGFARRLDELIPSTGTKVSDGLGKSARGATTQRFRDASRTAPAPLAGMGFLRVGEDGRLYFTAKAEHYHLSVGHSFPGYRLIETAKKLGITNCTHNNTRGHVTRVLEEQLVAAANGLGRGQDAELAAALDSKDPRVINRVINLETGSLVVEAAVKAVLARFYAFEPGQPEPKYAGRVPVILVLGDLEGGTGANYHGTTMMTQVMRGLWPGLAGKLEGSEALIVRPVKINDIADFKAVLGQWDSGRYKVAAFFHEIVLMNYGAILLEEAYMREAHALCREADVAVVVDEIQSCVWSPDIFMYREYGLCPDIVTVGKGLPGGEYPAARMLVNAAMDSLPQFGALVTNGQEELGSLAYLVTMEFARVNSAFTREVGDYYAAGLASLVKKHPQLLEKSEGRRHLSSLFFRQMDTVKRFVTLLNQWGIDISVQSYKPSFPPSCLTKLPITCTPRAVDFLLGKMDAALGQL
jgi:acetylornithine/succinyldiaminopimelate/putrescine aminotransferase